MMATVKDTWESVKAEAVACTACELCKSATRRVFSYPDHFKGQRPIMLIGEAPGAQEDIEGVPFVGPSGDKLFDHLERIGFKMSKAYIANTVKCRPPNNRTPTCLEIGACEHFLVRQMEIAGTQVLIPVGNSAASTVMGGTKFAVLTMGGREYVSRLNGDRGRINLPTFPVPHPSWALRGNDKAFGKYIDTLGVWLEAKHLL